MTPKNEIASPANDKILIIGGYGQVGRSIAEQLAPLFPGRVIVAGRHLEKAKTTVAEIGHDAEARAVNIFAEDIIDALNGVMLAVTCLDQTDTRFVEQCLSQGIHYVDISADYDFLSQVEKLDDLAKRNSVAAILSVGVAPGLTNMLAARASKRMDKVDRIDLILEFGLGDHHGQAAVELLIRAIKVSKNA